jgi:hypothetical protein
MVDAYNRPETLNNPTHEGGSKRPNSGVGFPFFMKCVTCGCDIELHKKGRRKKYCSSCAKIRIKETRKEWNKNNKYRYKLYHLNNKEKRNAQTRAYHKANKDRIKNYMSNYHANYYENNKNSILERVKRYSKQLKKSYRDKIINELSDPYIKMLFSQDGIKNPSNEMIEERRMVVKINRTIKQIKKQNPLL